MDTWRNSNKRRHYKAGETAYITRRKHENNLQKNVCDCAGGFQVLCAYKKRENCWIITTTHATKTRGRAEHENICRNGLERTANSATSGGTKLVEKRKGNSGHSYAPRQFERANDSGIKFHDNKQPARDINIWNLQTLYAQTAKQKTFMLMLIFFVHMLLFIAEIASIGKLFYWQNHLWRKNRKIPR